MWSSYTDTIMFFETLKWFSPEKGNIYWKIPFYQLFSIATRALMIPNFLYGHGYHCKGLCFMTKCYNYTFFVHGETFCAHVKDKNDTWNYTNSSFVSSGAEDTLQDVFFQSFRANRWHPSLNEVLVTYAKMQSAEMETIINAWQGLINVRFKGREDASCISRRAYWNI